MRTVTSVQARLDRRTAAADSNGCLMWTGRTNNAGYGSMTVQEDGVTRTRSVHRLAYELRVAPIGEGLTVDHLCRNKTCVNTDHMEIVTRSINVQRRDGASIDECRNGHRYTSENTRLRSDGRGLRICRACERAAAARYRAKAALR